jgi:hypothetical protein
MTLRASLHEFVRDNVDVSVSESKLPLRPMMPHIVLRFITGRTVQTMSNRRSLVPRRVQFDIYANNDTQVDAVATNLLRALDNFHGPMGDVSIGWAFMLNDLDMPPQEIKGGEIRYQRVVDFEVAYQEETANVLVS